MRGRIVRGVPLVAAGFIVYGLWIDYEYCQTQGATPLIKWRPSWPTMPPA